MTPDQQTSTSVAVIRYDRTRLRAGISFVAPAGLATIASRHFASPVFVAAALLLMAVGFAYMLRSRTRFGRAPVASRRGRVVVGTPPQKINPASVVLWTLDGNLARVYCLEFTWALRAGKGAPVDEMRRFLSSFLGKPKPLRRRGSWRVRRALLGVAGLAGIAVAVGLSFAWYWVAGIGWVTVLVALPAFAALTQKMVDDRPGGVA